MDTIISIMASVFIGIGIFIAYTLLKNEKFEGKLALVSILYLVAGIWALWQTIWWPLGIALALGLGLLKVAK